MHKNVAGNILIRFLAALDEKMRKNLTNKNIHCIINLNVIKIAVWSSVIFRWQKLQFFNKVKRKM